MKVHKCSDHGIALAVSTIFRIRQAITAHPARNTPGAMVLASALTFQGVELAMKPFAIISTVSGQQLSFAVNKSIWEIFSASVRDHLTLRIRHRVMPLKAISGSGDDVALLSPQSSLGAFGRSWGDRRIGGHGYQDFQHRRRRKRARQSGNSEATDLKWILTLPGNERFFAG